MIGILFAQEQVARLLGLKCFVSNEHKASAITEMEKAMQTAHNIAAAMAFANDWLAEQNEWPTPAQIRQLLFEAHQGRQEYRPDAETYAPDPLHCKRCQNFGAYGGKIGTKYDGEWKWCDCEAAIEKRRVEPDLVVLANETRNRLIEIISKSPKMIGRSGPRSNVIRTIAAISNEDYHGEF